MLVLYFIFLANIFCTSSFHGASFSNSFWAVLAFGRFSNKKFKYLYTFRSYAFAISIIVKQIALALAPSTESQNNQFFLPTVIGRIAFSLRLLLRLHLPSSKELIQEAQKYAKIDVIQPPFSIVNQSERELMEWAETQGIGTMTYGSLGGGILTGAIRELPKPDPKDMRQVFYPFFKEPVFSNVMELLKTLDKIAEAHNVPVAQVSINWSTQKSFVGTALTGVNTPAQADENCSAFEWQLNNEEIALIDSEIDRLNIG